MKQAQVSEILYRSILSTRNNHIILLDGKQPTYQLIMY